MTVQKKELLKAINKLQSRLDHLNECFGIEEDSDREVKEILLNACKSILATYFVLNGHYVKLEDLTALNKAVSDARKSWGMEGD